jgi:hypothetical protein
MFGIELLNGSESPEGIWDTRLAGNARRAVEDIARKFSKVTGDDTYTAFRKNFDTYGKNLVMKKVSDFTTYDGTVVYGGGYTNGPHLIHYAKINYPRDDSIRNNIVHELGHAFNQGRGKGPEHGLPSNYADDRSLFLHNNNDPGVMWQSNDANTNSETFADMFVAYTYDVWRNPIDTLQLQLNNPGDPSTWDPPKWMDDYMKNWLR